VIALVKIVILLIADAWRFAILSLRRSRSLIAENLFLRRQLALYKERGIKPRRVDSATRVSLALLSRLCEWRSALVVVRPETLLRWHQSRMANTVALEVLVGTSIDSAGAAPVDSAHGKGEPAVG